MSRILIVLLYDNEDDVHSDFISLFLIFLSFSFVAKRFIYYKIYSRERHIFQLSDDNKDVDADRIQ